MRRSLLAPLVIVSCLFWAGSISAQWTTETFELSSGWSAVYLHVDASHETLNTLVGADPDNPIEEIWLWAPSTSPAQFIDDPQQPSASSSQWLKWDRYWGGSSPMQRLVPNAAYLVRVRANVPSYTWTLQGKPVPPQATWTSEGLNFIGFSTPRKNPPMWGTFLGPSRSLHEHAEIYHYPGGLFGENNPARLWPTLLRSTPLTRGKASWVRAEEYNRYFGPVVVSLQSSGGIHFGSSLGQYRLRLSNTTADPVTVSANLVASEAAPAGERTIVGEVPLLLRGEIDMSDLTYGFTRFSEQPAEWTLAPKGEPGSEIEVVLGLERSAMSGNAGDLFAGVLRLTDGSGLIEVDLPVTADVASPVGLWVGNAIVNEVQHALAQYAEADGAPVQDEDGAYVVEEVDESFGPVIRPFSLRLLVHNSGEGDATLLQRVFYGPLAGDTVVLTKDERVLDSARLSVARRISTAHLPWTAENVSWAFDGPLNEAAEIEVTVHLAYDEQASNPFLHTYHPDHDNLDARFEQVLPEGAESYGVSRRIVLRVEPPGGDFAAITAGSGILSGTYEETVTFHGPGGSSRDYRVRGGFALSNIVDIATLTE